MRDKLVALILPDSAPLNSGAGELIGQILDGVGNNVPVTCGGKVGPLVDAIFRWAVDIGGLHALIAGGLQIIIMCCSHHNLFRLKVKQAYSVLINSRITFERAMHVAGKNEIPWETGAFRHGCQQHQ